MFCESTGKASGQSILSLTQMKVAFQKVFCIALCPKTCSCGALHATLSCIALWSNSDLGLGRPPKRHSTKCSEWMLRPTHPTPTSFQPKD